MRILLVEDDVILSDLLLRSLSNQNYVIDLASDGQMGWEYAEYTNYDLIVLDVELPQLNGIALCQRLRANGCSTPILLITAKDASTERIRGLDAGADDYLTKPLDLAELQARVRALLRRNDGTRSPILEMGGLRLDPSSCRVTFNGKPLALTPKEYNLLELFLRNPSRVFSRGNIIEHLWTFDDPPQEESVKSHIKGLRQKLRGVGAVDWIENVYGLGYRLKESISNQELLEQDGVQAREDQHLSNDSTLLPLNLSDTSQQSTSQIYTDAVATLWQRYQPLMAQRLSLLQQAAIELQTQSLSVESHQSAIEAAHKLAGVLGMFDRDEGTVIARTIEELLSETPNLNESQADRVQSLIHTLEKLLNIEPSSEPSLQNPPASEMIPVPALLPENNSSGASVKVLVVDDDSIFLAALRPVLEPWGIHMTGLTDPLRFEELLQSMTPDLVILDVEMPHMSGIELCQVMRSNDRWWDIPILFLTAHRDLDTIQRVLSVGADDYVVKPVVGAELLTRITNRLERTRLLKTLSTKDPITGLANQPQSSREIESLLQQSQLTSFCFVVLYIEQLRQINAQYGHTVGNQVLQHWGRVLKTVFHSNEILGYWGNGEFVIGIPNCTKVEITQRLSAAITPLQQQTLTTLESDRILVSCHWSISVYPTDGVRVRQLYQIACQSLESA